MSWNMRLLKNLASLRLTVGLLLWLAFLCVIGTVVAQHALPPMPGAGLAMTAARLLSPGDVFHSLWFLIPTAVLCINAIACMYLRRNSFVGPSSMPRSGLHEVTIPGEVDTGKISADLAVFMKGRYRIVSSHEEDREVIQCERGALRRLAPLMVHLSIVMILLGVGLAFLGYKGSLTVPVGQATDVVTLNDGTSMQLPFEVRCDDFSMELYDNGMPREYRSEISLLRMGSVLMRSSVLVNHPVSFSGILFSQSGYNKSLVADIRVATPSGTVRISGPEGSSVAMKDTGYRVHVVKVIDDIMSMGPGVQLIVEKPESEEEIWIFRQFEQIRAMHPGILEKMPHFNPSRVEPYYFSLGGVAGSYVTTLGVNRDPGVIFVGLGSLLFMVGICIAFMVVHERVWISIEQDPQGVVIKAAQRINGKPSAVSPDIAGRISALAGGKT